MMPVDVVPSALQIVLLPLCEGILVGLAAGCLILLALKAVEYFFAPADRPVSTPRVIVPSRISTRLPTRSRPAARLPLAKAS
jgi:xanthine/uracil/vitamin C permease (AzgA family)